MKKMKKPLALLLAFLMLMTTLPLAAIPAFAAETSNSVVWVDDRMIVLFGAYIKVDGKTELYPYYGPVDPQMACYGLGSNGALDLEHTVDQAGYQNMYCFELLNKVPGAYYFHFKGNAANGYIGKAVNCIIKFRYDGTNCYNIDLYYQLDYSDGVLTVTYPELSSISAVNSAAVDGGNVTANAAVSGNAVKIPLAKESDAPVPVALSFTSDGAAYNESYEIYLNKDGTATDGYTTDVEEPSVDLSMLETGAKIIYGTATYGMNNGKSLEWSVAGDGKTGMAVPEGCIALALNNNVMQEFLFDNQDPIDNDYSTSNITEIFNTGINMTNAQKSAVKPRKLEGGKTAGGDCDGVAGESVTVNFWAPTIKDANALKEVGLSATGWKYALASPGSYGTNYISYVNTNGDISVGGDLVNIWICFRPVFYLDLSKIAAVNDVEGAENTYTLKIIHTHAFSEEWTKTETAHWHACTAEECDIEDYSTCGIDEVAYGTHTGMEDFVCDTCGYTDTEGQLAAAKTQAKADIEALAGEDDSDEVTAIIEKALADIENAASTAAVEEIAAAAEKDVAEQKAAEALADAIGAAKTNLNTAKSNYVSDEAKAAIDEAVAALADAESINEVNTIVDNAATAADEADETLEGDKEAAEEWLRAPLNTLSLGYYSPALIEELAKGIDELTSTEAVKQYKADCVAALREAREEAFEDNAYLAIVNEIEALASALGFDDDETEAILADFDEFISEDYEGKTVEEIINALSDEFYEAEDEEAMKAASAKLCLSLILTFNSDWTSAATEDEDDMNYSLMQSMMIFDDNAKFVEFINEDAAPILGRLVSDCYSDYIYCFTRAAFDDDAGDVFDTAYAALLEDVTEAKAAIDLAAAKEDAAQAVEALASENDSDEVTAIIEKALADIENAETTAAVEAIVDAAEADVAEQKAAETLVEAIETAKENLEAAKENYVSDEAKAAIDEAISALDSAASPEEVETIAETAETAAAEADVALEEAIETAKSNLETAKETAVSDEAKATIDEAIEALDDAESLEEVEMIVETAEADAETDDIALAEAKGLAEEEILAAVPEDAPAGVKETANGAVAGLADLNSIDAVNDAVENAKNTIEKKYAQAVSDAKDNAETVLEQAKEDAASDEAKAAIDEAIAALADAESITDVNTIVDNAETDAAEADKALEDAKADAKDALEEAAENAIADDAKEALEAAIEDMDNATSLNAVADKKAAAEETAEAAETELADAKAAAIKEIEDAAGTERSAALARLVNEKEAAVNAASSPETVESIIEKAFDDIDYRKVFDGFKMPDIYHRLKYKDTVALQAESTTNKVVYTSSDTSVATVDENGVVTAVGKGECVITAAVEGTDISKDCKIKVDYNIFDIIMYYINLIVGKVVGFFKSLFTF